MDIDDIKKYLVVIFLERFISSCSESVSFSFFLFFFFIFLNFFCCLEIAYVWSENQLSSKHLSVIDIVDIKIYLIVS